MSIMDSRRKIELVKEVLKSIHKGEDVNVLKEKFRSVLSKISPFEIPFIEQELVKEGISVNDILKLCDLHVELFREFLEARELKGVPKGHPLDLLMRENEWILKRAEALSLYSNAILNAKNLENALKNIETLKKIVLDLKNIRLHYRKVQMLIFPYLERRGINAVPRVLWGREDRVIVKIREILEFLNGREIKSLDEAKEVANETLNLAREVSELVFRENKILYPAVWALFSEGEWATIHDVGAKMGYLVDIVGDWKPEAKPIYPYEIDEAVVTKEQMEKLPEEIRRIIASKGLEPDRYRIREKSDIDLNTGFLNVEEIKALFSSLPLEITYANRDDRVKFFTSSRIGKGFVRTKTIIGRRVGYCHPPRLEAFVMKVVRDLKETGRDYRVFWTKQGDRIIRVMIVAVKDEKGNYLGVAEIVEDMTDIVMNPEEIKKKILVL